MFRILLVDDKEIFLRTIIRMPFFRKNREKVQIAWALNSASEALDVLRREHVDIVMTDIRMPMMSGLDLLKIIQRENLCGCTILMSEYTEFAYAREGILYGAFDYIVKPLKDDLISQTLTRALSHLRKSEDIPEEDGLSAEDMIRLILTPENPEFEKELRDVTLALTSLNDPGATVHRVRHILLQLMEVFSSKYAYVGSYLPLKTLFSLPETAEPEADAGEAAVTYLARTLRFLHRKASLFNTVSVNSQVRNIWFYTIKNSDESCRLAETAQRFFLNPSYLSSLFKKETGISYKAFVQDLKIERAKYLLSFSSLKISEIAELLKYSDAEYFRKTFKASTGISPTKFNYDDYITLTIGQTEGTRPGK